MIKLNYPLNIFNSTLKAFVSLYNVAPWKSAVSGPTALINLEHQTNVYLFITLITLLITLITRNNANCEIN